MNWNDRADIGCIPPGTKVLTKGYWSGTLRYLCCGKVVPFDLPAEANIAVCPECYQRDQRERDMLRRFHRDTWEHRLVCRFLGCPFSG